MNKLLLSFVVVAVLAGCLAQQSAEPDLETAQQYYGGYHRGGYGSYGGYGGHRGYGSYGGHRGYGGYGGYGGHGYGYGYGHGW